MDKPPIGPVDYQRIFRTIYSVLSNEKGDLTKACYHINYCAAAILNQHYKLKATPHTGIAAYCVSEKPLRIIGFFELKDGIPDVNGMNNHCWIQVNGWHLDFTTPLFPELAAQGGINVKSRKRFCKRISKGKEDPADLRAAGDFFAYPDQAKSLATWENINSKPGVIDLISICCQWYSKPPKSMQRAIQIGKTNQGLTTVLLSTIEVQGAW
jgi:hypothetical protein